MRYLHVASICGAAILHLGACSGTPPAQMPDGGSGMDMATVMTAPGTAVNGTDITTFITETGSSNVPNDLTSYTIAALVPNLLSGTTTLMGTGAGDGAWTIPNVPAGTFYLQYGNPDFPYNYIITSAHQFDMGTFALGREDVNFSSTSTTFSPNITGLTAWGKSDHLEMISSNAGAFCYDITDQSNRPAAGVTSVNIAKLSYANYFYPGPLIDGTVSDLAYITQLSTQTSAVVGSYTGIVNSALLPSSFGVLDAQDNPIVAALTPVTQTMFQTNFAIAQFESLPTAGTPSAKVAGTFMYLESQPAGLSNGPVGPGFDMLEVSMKPGNTATATGALSYGNPYPSSYGTYVNAITGFNVSYQIPGLVTPLTLQGSIASLVDASTLGATGLTPLVGPVQNMKINGKAATGTLTGVTATPTITFDPPTVGKADFYTVAIAGVTVNSSRQPGTQLVAQFRTQGTTVKVPTGPLMTGAAYIVSVTALSGPQDSPTAPGKPRFPQGRAVAFSGIIEP